MELSHNDCLEVLANPSTRIILEKLGYEYSDRGLSQFRNVRPNIVPALVQTIVDELEEHPVFPPGYRNLIPEIGLYIRKEGDDFLLKDIEKPSIWEEDAFDTPEGAAKEYIRRVIDAYWLRSDTSDRTLPKSVKSNWQHPKT